MRLLARKVILVGPQGVGKTSTIIRYVDNSYSTHISPTIGASFFTCRLAIQDIHVKLQIWDTAGQERFKAMAPMFYRNANAAILVYDITNPSSFESMKGWVLELQRNIDEPLVLCVVGNKIDLAENRKVTRDEAFQYASSIGASYYECSAKDDRIGSMSEESRNSTFRPFYNKLLPQEGVRVSTVTQRLNAARGVGVIFENIALGLVNMLEKSGEKSSTTLKVYDNEKIGAVMAKSTDLKATDTGKEEAVNVSIDSIAHGRSVKSCC